MDKFTAGIGKMLKEKFPLFGINKIRELTRLVFEISKREKSEFSLIVNSIQETNYEKVKNFLLQIRYPEAYGKVSKDRFYLAEIDIVGNQQADVNLKSFYPKNIYYTNEVKNSFLYDRVKLLYPDSKYTEIESLKDFSRKNKFSVSQYNSRKKKLF